MSRPDKWLLVDERQFDGKGVPIVATGRDTAEIKGWMTFDDIAKGYNVSLEEIAKAFDLPLDQVAPDKALNKLETDQFSVTKLRQWLDARKEPAYLDLIERSHRWRLKEGESMGKEKILVVDDEEKIVAIVKAYLEKDGYRVVTAYDGKQAIALARREQPDLVVLDLMLPETSGWDVFRTLRAESPVPVVMLTARDDDSDKIVGLEMGADDYVTKPFNPREVLARVRAVLRRAGGESKAQGIIRIGNLTVDPVRHEVRRDGESIALTPTEFALLELLVRHPGRAFTRLQLLDLTQGESYEGFERAVDSHIKNLRQKIEPEPGNPRYVLTVFGVGYKMAELRDA